MIIETLKILKTLAQGNLFLFRHSRVSERANVVRSAMSARNELMRDELSKSDQRLVNNQMN